AKVLAHIWSELIYCFVVYFYMILLAVCNIPLARILLYNYIIGKSSRPQFKVPEFRIKREDSTDIRNKVLNLTLQDRKRLGINKSTLWYIQKHIKEGKKVKVYGKVVEKIR
ncbi:MAG: hypothetical protein QXL94_06840, partial [Candidatus Parvarchaeum sp.]